MWIYGSRIEGVGELFQEWFDKRNQRLSQDPAFGIWEMKESSLRSCLDWVKFLQADDYGVVQNFFNQNSMKPKSDLESICFREQGNRHFQKRNWEEALISYKKALAFATKATTLALAYANRSAVLLHLNKEEACLRDVQRALDSGYPEDLSHKLFERRGKCYVKLKMYSDARASFKQALELARKNVRDKDKLLQLTLEVEKADKAAIVAANAVELSCSQLSLDDDGFDFKNPKLKSTNPQAPSFSDAVKLVFSEEKGRHAVATRNIECGEIIYAVQRNLNYPFEKYLGKVCSHCLAYCLDMIPTDQNTKDMFCSEDCLKRAEKTYLTRESLFHRSLGLLRFHMAIRAILSYSKSFLLDQLARHEPDETNLTPDEGFSSLLNMQARHLPHSIHRNVVGFEAFVCLKFLQKVGYFGHDDQPSTTLSDEELSIAKLLIRLLCIDMINAFGVGAMDGKNVRVYVGASILPSLLFNHSCDPNTLTYTPQGKCVVMANRSIPKGEELFLTYTKGFYEAPYAERQETLLYSYGFQCKCTACSKSWPVKPKLPKSFTDLRKGQLKIPQTLVQFAALKLSKLLEQAASGENKQKFANYIAIVKLLEETIERPHDTYIVVELAMFEYVWSSL